MPEETAGTEQPGAAQTQETQLTPSQTLSWDEAFKGMDPAKVREALDNSRKWESRAKENFEKAKQFDQLEEARLSESEKLTRRAESAEQTAATAQSEAVRLQVALEHGFVVQKDGKFTLDADALSLLGNGTAEELAERAKQIAALRQAPQPQQQPFSHGPGSSQAPKDMNSLIFGQLRK